jgi:hypothetical protein
MNVVLDASAMIAFLRGEPGSDVVERYFGPETHNLYAHALNLCEVYYDFLRAADEASAEGAVRDRLASLKPSIAGFPLRIVVLWRWLAAWEPCSSPPTGTNLNLSLTHLSARSNSFDSEIKSTREVETPICCFVLPI